MMRARLLACGGRRPGRARGDRSSFPGPGGGPPPRALRHPSTARARAGDRQLGAAPDSRDRRRREGMSGTLAVERFTHEALLYSDMDEYLAGTLAFIREGLAVSEPILVVVGAAKIAALKAPLWLDARPVPFKHMGARGADAAPIIPAPPA